MATDTCQSSYRTRIKEWPAEERPREKMLRFGSSSLSDAELLALLIGSGTGGATAVDIAKHFLVKHRHLNAVAGQTVHELARLKGIGPARASRIAAAFEIGRRVEAGGDYEGRKIRAPEDLVRYYGPRFRDLKQEIFSVVLLDSGQHILRDVQISSGTLNASLVHPREVFKPAIDHVAAGIVLIHNHPSGVASPSDEDRRITMQIKQAGDIVDIPVLDHIILAKNRFYSFAKEGLL